MHSMVRDNLRSWHDSFIFLWEEVLSDKKKCRKAAVLPLHVYFGLFEWKEIGCCLATLNIQAKYLNLFMIGFVNWSCST